MNAIQLRTELVDALTQPARGENTDVARITVEVVTRYGDRKSNGRAAPPEHRANVHDPALKGQCGEAVADPRRVLAEVRAEQLKRLAGDRTAARSLLRPSRRVHERPVEGDEDTRRNLDRRNPINFEEYER